MTVLLADDQRLVRSGFALMLSAEDDIEVVGEAADGQQAILAAERLHPDVVLMDVQMPVMDGIAATEALVARDLGKVIIVTTFDRDDYIFDGLTAGASGFLLKNAEPERLVEAVRAVGHGHALLAPEVTRRVIEEMTSNAGPGASDAPAPSDSASRRHEHERQQQLLTRREREVLVLLARGRSNAEIAATLVVSQATVKTHVSSCLSKLDLRDRIHAVVFAYEAGLILPGE
ncbi:MAG: response regulator [Nocardioidaceae bacterium]